MIAETRAGLSAHFAVCRLAYALRSLRSASVGRIPSVEAGKPASGASQLCQPTVLGFNVHLTARGTHLGACDGSPARLPHIVDSGSAMAVYLDGR
jgi:hypothetical protein